MNVSLGGQLNPFLQRAAAATLAVVPYPDVQDQNQLNQASRRRSALGLAPNPSSNHQNGAFWAAWHGRQAGRVQQAQVPASYFTPHQPAAGFFPS